MVTLHDVMTVDLLTIEPEATLREAAELFAAEHVSGLPVVAGSEVVGVISVSDLMRFDADRPSSSPRHRDLDEPEWAPGEEIWPASGEDEAAATYYTEIRDNVATELSGRFGQLQDPARDDLGERQVGDIMTRDLLTLSPEVEVREAARRMLLAEVHRVLVVEEDRLLGVVSTTDMMKAVAQYGLGG